MMKNRQGTGGEVGMVSRARTLRTGGFDNRRVFVALLLLAGLPWLPAFAAGLKITGIVQDEGGAPVVGAEIVLTPVDNEGNPTDEPVVRSKTNKKGKFSFGFAKPGGYKVAVDAEGLQLRTASIKMRNGDRKPVYGPEGLIEDVTAAVNPENPVIGLGIPRDAFYVELDFTVGQPAVAAPAASATELEKQIVGSGLGEEVEQVLGELEAQRFPAALDEVDALITDNPELAPLYYLKGFVLVKLDRLADAEQALRQSLLLDPEIASASGLLGQILGEQGRYEEAVPLLRTELAQTEDPASRAPMLLALGQALLETGDPDEAVSALEQARDLRPDDPNIQTQLADAYIRSGHEQAAEDLMADEGDLDPKAAAVLHYNLGSGKLREEKYEEGIQHMKRALELNPDLYQCHQYLAQAYLALGDRRTAIAEYEAYLEAAPDAPDADMVHRLIKALKDNLDAK